MTDEKIILDASCGGRMMWFDKTHPRAIYIDKRQVPPGSQKTRPNFKIMPDLVMDFTALEFPDKKFKLIVWDPPHLKSLDLNSWVALKYGTLDPETWRETIYKGFAECWRVLDDNGVLIFKWSRSGDNRRKRDVSTAEILKLIPIEPLFGHPTRSRQTTIWMAFMKLPGAPDIKPWIPPRQEILK